MSVVKGGVLELARDTAFRVLVLPAMGRGLFATQPVLAGATLLEEAPIVSTPPVRKVRDGSWCRTCCSPGQACGHVHPEPELGSVDLSPLLGYCEERGFKWPLLMARLAARALQKGRRRPPSAGSDEALERMRFLCSVNLKGREARLEEQREVLLDCFKRPRGDSVLSIDWYMDLYSRIQANAFRLDLVDSAAFGGEEGSSQSYQEVLRRMLSQQEDGDGGSAVYTVASLFNHSCGVYWSMVFVLRPMFPRTLAPSPAPSLAPSLARSPVPNVDVTFPKNDHTIVMRANQEVRENEQLTITYIDTGADVEERAARLAMYGFRCECEKCREER
jgi:hypothetical protein